ncbi:hypothetical protein [Psychromarinibacter halotolerans]|uniref:Uncharacterized protein n=1 Tax=Psychromarinibacter halotolerans TaxID=1775175 RepID=A0ABV7GTZ3_9RHOB|nr:hypothetical protein [Psychromarinibacter halotolerans]MDF0598108.1 hypothetical protein [Psychromarinibacter halotolerans]
MTTLRTMTGLAVASVTLVGCIDMEDDTPSGPDRPAELALFGTGYPNPGDPCLRAGESAFTATYLDDAADLVACPPGTDPGLFAYTTGGREVARLDGWIVFSIPRR